MNETNPRPGLTKIQQNQDVLTVCHKNEDKMGKLNKKAETEMVHINYTSLD